jgi:hypothetical protein
MTTGTLLLNLDLAAGITALVAMAMIAVPNIERIRALRRVLSRRPSTTQSPPAGLTWWRAASSGRERLLQDPQV